MVRINHAHAIPLQEPNLPIRGFRSGWTIRVIRNFVYPHSFGTAENGRVEHLLRSLILVCGGGPSVYLGPRQAHQPTLGIQPEGVIVVLYHPVNRITR